MSGKIGQPPMRLKPTAQRPLLGLTVLLVEDSRYASEAIRLMCLRSGARIRRADSVRSARRHMAAYRPSVAIVDMGLPDGSGATLLRELSAPSDPIPVRLAMSGDDGASDAALAAGAQAFMAKPFDGLAAFQDIILRLLPPEARPAGPREIPNETVQPDPLAYIDDMAHAADLIGTCRPDPDTLRYIAQFTGAAARAARDSALASAAQELLMARPDQAACDAALARLRMLVSDRMQSRAIV